MHARTLYVLHYAGYEHVNAVGYGVDFKLGAHKVLVAEDGVFNLLRKYYVHIPLYVVLREGDGHILAAYYVRGAQEHGIAELFGGGDGLFLGHYRKSLGAGYRELFQKFVEPLPVLGEVHAVCGGAEYSYALLVEVAAQLYGSLPAEGYNHAVGLFNVDYRLHVLGRERFEVQPVGRVEVGGYRFGVIVYYYYFIAELFERPHAVNGRIVEFDALTYAYGAGTYNYYPALFAALYEGLGLVVVGFVVGRIEVRRLRRELCAAGVNHLEHGVPVHRQLVRRNLFELFVGVAHLFAVHILRARHRLAHNLVFEIHEVFELFQKPLVYLGD